MTWEGITLNVEDLNAAKVGEGFFDGLETPEDFETDMSEYWKKTIETPDLVTFAWNDEFFIGYTILQVYIRVP